MISLDRRIKSFSRLCQESMDFWGFFTEKFPSNLGSMKNRKISSTLNLKLNYKKVLLCRVLKKFSFDEFSKVTDRSQNKIQMSCLKLNS